MTTHLLIMLGVTATAVAVEYGLLRISFERWRLFDIVFIGAFANGLAWGAGLTAFVWLRLARMLEELLSPAYPWYFCIFFWACLFLLFGVASVLPASVVALVYQKRRSTHGTAA